MVDIGQGSSGEERAPLSRREKVLVWTALVLMLLSVGWMAVMLGG